LELAIALRNQPARGINGAIAPRFLNAHDLFAKTGGYFFESSG